MATMVERCRQCRWFIGINWWRDVFPRFLQKPSPWFLHNQNQLDKRTSKYLPHWSQCKHRISYSIAFINHLNTSDAWKTRRGCKQRSAPGGGQGRIKLNDSLSLNPSSHGPHRLSISLIRPRVQGETKCTSQRVGKNRRCQQTCLNRRRVCRFAGSVGFYPRTTRYILYPRYPRVATKNISACE